MYQQLVILSLFAFAYSASVGGGSAPAFCHGLDCPEYTVARTFSKGYELRNYKPSKWVATNLTAMEFTDDNRREMFYKLFYYISGNNSAHMKINMTAPVLREVFHGPGPTCESTFITHFMIPFGLQNDVKAPTDPSVYIRDMPAMSVYVRSFPGHPSAQDSMNELQKLADQINDPSQYEDMFYFFAGYDGPYVLSSKRHNEVWLVAKN
ncbi:hypothetical protein FSP39_010229 [Pinctada imbricata]|uniref:Heme-binding protein 2 n=1 Tax=Pinctada imbricata TaxID=66713 RepID=A0AA89C719_PINIB|nr:hypothetical protein FSP39_010229 [Pinctada imbricata]